MQRGKGSCAAASCCVPTSANTEASGSPESKERSANCLRSVMYKASYSEHRKSSKADISSSTDRVSCEMVEASVPNKVESRTSVSGIERQSLLGIEVEVSLWASNVCLARRGRQGEGGGVENAAPRPHGCCGTCSAGRNCVLKATARSVQAGATTAICSDTRVISLMSMSMVLTAKGSFPQTL